MILFPNDQMEYLSMLSKLEYLMIDLLCHIVIVK